MYQHLLDALPYSRPFLFVDHIDEISDQHVIGRYTYRTDETFYEGHFKNNPVTPGVILIETMAQIGGVVLAFHLLGNNMHEYQPLFTHIENAEFLGTVPPNTTVVVIGKKQYFRRNVLKVAVEMTDIDGNPLCNGTISCQFVAPQRHNTSK